MRTDEERISVMHRRAVELEKEKKDRQVRILEIISFAACFSAVVVLSVIMPGFSGTLIRESTGSFSASIFSGSSILGFLVTGIIAFLLGVTVTAFCFQLRKRQEEKNGEEP